MSKVLMNLADEATYEEEEEYYCILDISSLEIGQNIPNLSKRIETSVQHSLEKINLNVRGYNKVGVKRIYIKNLTIVKQIMLPLFWHVYGKLFHNDQVDTIKGYSSLVSLIWGRFCLPFDSDPHVPESNRQGFYFSFPYFCTQTIQELFIIVSYSSPQVLTKQFRMSICNECVMFFSGISLTEAHLLERLSLFFSTAPPALYFSRAPEKVEKIESKDNSLLPVEDLSTLVKTDPRSKPKNEKWSITMLSPAISLSVGHDSIPFKPEAFFLIQHPGSSETSLPPLLPKIQPLSMERGKYNPMIEPRSLIHRSLRANLTNSVSKLQETFQQHYHEYEVGLAKKEEQIEKDIATLSQLNPIQQEIFFTKLRKLQEERKRDETPEIADIIQETNDAEMNMNPNKDKEANKDKETNKDKNTDKIKTPDKTKTPDKSQNSDKSKPQNKKKTTEKTKTSEKTSEKSQRKDKNTVKISNPSKTKTIDKTNKMKKNQNISSLEVPSS